MTLTRRQFTVGSAAAALWATAASGRAIGRRQPNVLFIMADDLGYADLSCYGARDYHTPVLDRVARQGVKLTQGYASSCICSATRVALATGHYQQRYRVGLEEPVGVAAEPVALPDGTPTIATYFRSAGYRTALIGKWHVGVLPFSLPTRYGYDHFYGIRSGAADYFSHRNNLTKFDPDDGLYRDEARVDEPGYLTDLLADEAVRYVSKGDARPFFLSLHFTAPHWPWEGPDDAEVSRKLKDIWHRDGGSLETYAKMVVVMDTAIGRVLDAITAAGEENNTIVVFTSDNGGERFSDTWPFTGVKGELLEGGLRVPIILKWPNVIKAGSTSEQVMASMDFLPTLLAATQRDANAQRFKGDGMNLLPVLAGQAEPVARTIFWRFKASEQAAVRSGDWKYLKMGGKEHLFNVRIDPRERARLNDIHPDKFNELRQQYDEWNKQMLPYPLGSYSDSAKSTYPDRY